jgi:radical SAM protein with 4Fe4S-binding SPASM domain
MLMREVAARICFSCGSEYCVPSSRVRFEVSNCCNLRCTMCPQRGLMQREKRLMDIALYQNVLDRNKYIRFVELWNWGEPLLHPQLGSFIRYAHDRHIRTAITTNATLLTKEKSHELLQAGLDYVYLSLDNVGARYEKVRGTSWAKVAENVSAFTRIAKEYGGRLRIAANVVDSRENPIDHEDFIASLRELGVTDVLINSWSVYGNLDGFSQRTCPCREWYRDVVVLVDGRVIPCAVDYEGDLTYGSVQDEPNLRRLFNSPQMRAYRRAMRSPATMPKACRNCVEYCGSLSVPKFR